MDVVYSVRCSQTTPLTIGRKSWKARKGPMMGGKLFVYRLFDIANHQYKYVLNLYVFIVNERAGNTTISQSHFGSKPDPVSQYSLQVTTTWSIQQRVSGCHTMPSHLKHYKMEVQKNIFKISFSVSPLVYGLCMCGSDNLTRLWKIPFWLLSGLSVRMWSPTLQADFHPT